MPGRRYRAIRERDRKGADVRGVAAFDPQPGEPWRQIAWQIVGRDAQGEIEARALAIEMERQEAEHGERFLSWQMDAWAPGTEEEFELLGRVLEVTDVTVKGFVAITEGKSGAFVFNARFENAPAVVRVGVREARGEVRVEDSHVSPAFDLPRVAPSEAML